MQNCQVIIQPLADEMGINIGLLGSIFEWGFFLAKNLRKIGPEAAKN